jgi:hypothetical protein
MNDVAKFMKRGDEITSLCSGSNRMRFRFLLCGKVAVACLVLGISTTTFAQHINISVGVKGGVP